MSAPSETPLKQFFINHKIFQDSVLKAVASRQSATGLVLGKRGDASISPEKALIYDVVLVPDPEDSQKDLKEKETVPNRQKGLLQLLTTKYPDFNYTDWVIECKSAVSRE